MRGTATRDVVVPGGEGPIDVAPLALGPPDHREWFGKPAPEIAAKDLDTGKPVMLADFRGKVVVLDFWGYWCGPCTGSMPYLISCGASSPAGRSRSSPCTTSPCGLVPNTTRRSPPPGRIFWSGHDLPFRVLLDRPDEKQPEDRDPEGTGTTVNRYGITGFPSLFVIAADGTFVEKVGHSMHDRLESLVRELLEKAEALSAKADGRGIRSWERSHAGRESRAVRIFWPVHAGIKQTRSKRTKFET